MNTLGIIGEFPFIERLQRIFLSSGRRVLIGIGDDCAVVEGREGHPYLLTCDTQVEGVHFLPSLIPPHRVGRRLVAVNLSDIAAMGGKPLFALLSCVWRSDIEEKWALEFAEGVQEESNRFGVSVVGGNLAQTSQSLILDITVVGEVDGFPQLLRRFAAPGHLVMVTGTLGDAAAGLEVLKRWGLEGEKRYPFLVERYWSPAPRLNVGQMLASTGQERALIDISDGFCQDLGHILDQSGCGMEIDLDGLPLSNAMRRYCEETGSDPLSFALSGGDDYELIFTAQESEASCLCRQLEEKTGVKISVVGKIVAEKVRKVKQRGNELKTFPAGWQHFGTKERKEEK